MEADVQDLDAPGDRAPRADADRRRGDDERVTRDVGAIADAEPRVLPDGDPNAGSQLLEPVASHHRGLGEPDLRRRAASRHAPDLGDEGAEHQAAIDVEPRRPVSLDAAAPGRATPCGVPTRWPRGRYLARGGYTTMKFT